MYSLGARQIAIGFRRSSEFALISGFMILMPSDLADRAVLVAFEVVYMT
jgi:hypothetical protein